MRAIEKSHEPRSLAQYRVKNREYDGPNFTPIKVEIRTYLLAEQGYLCAYCMKRISTDSMKIEHWACQHDHPELELSYKNMLGCCMGNEGKPKNLQTCDTRKGSDCIKFNPSEPNHHVNDLIKFHGDGKIYSTDSEFNIQLVKVLNLNSDRLVRNRTLLIDSIRKELNAKKGKRTKSEIKKLIAVYLEVDTDGKLKEYYGVAINYLSAKI
ncbi:retron system putative HNH endonuclease [Brenneria goodwinii]|uniref:TIGR02646 family protein n=1 Tax=Lonsdalea britannica TaxID=1082704 RepID=A0AAD0WKN8_9GAMM|nr:retron system putative HNH endonuclease [Lonsdalea britannica]AXW87006.1 TIGR02646 family protein [Lonsdalea britannica]